MIIIKDLSKQYDNRYVLENLNVKLPDNGLIFIVGASGCGKTTLLNAISGLIEYDGSIQVDGIQVELLKGKKSDDFRLTNIGFIFQDYKLFENDTVYNNVSFPIDLLGTKSNFGKKQKIKELLSLVGLEDKRNQRIANCSGGEKQRVAIARALVNDPKYILADEPTGALDSKNGDEILKLLKQISIKTLVIVVSHDISLAESYADRIIEIDDGKICNDVTRDTKQDKKNVFIPRNEYVNRKHTLPISTIFRHCFSSIKNKKWRTLLSTMVTSIGLLGVGLSVLLSSSIKNNITDAYSSVIDGTSVLVQSSNNDVQYIESCEENTIKNVVEAYHEYIYDYGSVYVKDFSSLFPDKEDFVLVNDVQKIELSNYSFKHINEFYWLDTSNDVVYPSKPEHLNNDEIVLGLNLASIQSICYSLKILRSIESLSTYLENNDIQIVIDVENKEWSYNNQEIYSLKGFTLTNKPCIFHYNHKWNEYVFENCFKLLSSPSLSSKDKYPWTLKKFFYFKVRENRDKLLKILRYDKNYDETFFEIANKSFFSYQIEKDYDVSQIDDILVFKNNSPLIYPRMIDIISNSNDKIDTPLIDTGGSYILSGSSLLMGFSNYTFFSFDKDQLSNNVEIYSTMDQQELSGVINSSDVLVGHYAKSNENAVIFNTIPNYFKDKSLLEDDSNIVISSHLYNSLNKENFDNNLYIAFCLNENTFGSNNVVRNYVIKPLKVVGIIESNYNQIYQNLDWLISYFQTQIGVSIYSLQIRSICYSIKGNEDASIVINEMSRDFPKYEISSPIYEISKSVDEVCGYIEFALIAFSLVAIIVSSILLTLSTYLFISENKKEIGLLRCIGATQYESSRLQVYYCLILSCISFIFSSIEIVIISFAINKVIGLSLGTSSLSINPMCFLYMFLIVLFVSFISSLLVVFHFRKLTPLEAMKK